jgi:hypothetical protein
LLLLGSQERLRARPLFEAQRQDKRVVKLPPGRPALLAKPAPNADNDNSAVLLSYQVLLAHPRYSSVLRTRGERHKVVRAVKCFCRDPPVQELHG